MSFTTVVGAGDPALDQRLSDELDAFNAAAISGAGEQRELTVRIEDGTGLAAGRGATCARSLRDALARLRP